MKKRLLSLLCVVCLLLTALPTGAFAVEGEETLPVGQAAEGGETKEKTPPDDRTDGEDGGQAPLVGAMTVTEFVTLDPDELDGFSDTELLEGYLYSVSGLYGGTSLFRAPVSELTVLLTEVKDELEEQIRQVAKGELASTKFNFHRTWSLTPAEWGISETDAVFQPNGELTAAAKEAVDKKLGAGALLQRLLLEMPYELYWFDKTEGMRTSYEYMPELVGENLVVENPVISMTVSKDYAVGNAKGTYEVDTTTTTAKVNAAVSNAKALVTEKASLSDYNKLDAYRKYITDAVSYNDDAAATTYTGGYGDPWQLIYVFDGDSTTNVVCEGYAKAFQYLCDLTTSFTGDVTCALVTGNMAGGTGAGRHMWNVVHMEEGKNYLVDVTNCDEGTVGAPKQLFLWGGTGTVADGYTFTSESGQTVNYTYDKETLDNYEEAGLKLSDSAYTLPKPAPTITFSSSYLYGYDFIYSGIPITAGQNGVSLTYVPDLRYHYAGDEAPTFTVEWLKVDGGTETSMGNDPQKGPPRWATTSSRLPLRRPQRTVRPLRNNHSRL